MCDDFSTIYYDGVEQKNVAGTGNWKSLATSKFPASTKEVMVECKNDGGANGIKAEILDASSFVCHKNNELQCAGHMLIKGQENDFVRLADSLKLPTGLNGHDQVFDSPAECIAHHS